MSDGPLSADQIRLVQDTFAKVEAVADGAAAIFYNRLFEDGDRLRGRLSDDLGEIQKIHWATLKVAVSYLDNLPTITPAVQQLGERCRAKGISEGDIKSVERALLWAVEQAIGDDFTGPAREAWCAAYGLMTETMHGRAAAD